MEMFHMTEQPTAQPTPPNVSATTTDGLPPQVATAPPAAEKQPPWGSPENFNPETAWELIQTLRAEKGDPDARREVESLRTSKLRKEMDEMREQQQSQRDALAAALGIKPEETSDTEKLTQQLSALQAQVLASERRAVAAEYEIPEQFQHLLTATDSEGLKKQATELFEFAKAAATATPPPAFQQNPGQGQGNAPLTPEAQQQAEYERYYPPTPPRR
jgi:hypothetical protein